MLAAPGAGNIPAPCDLLIPAQHEKARDKPDLLVDKRLGVVELEPARGGDFGAQRGNRQAFAVEHRFDHLNAFALEHLGAGEGAGVQEVLEHVLREQPYLPRQDQDDDDYDRNDFHTLTSLSKARHKAAHFAPRRAGSRKLHARYALFLCRGLDLRENLLNDALGCDRTGKPGAFEDDAVGQYGHGHGLYVVGDHIIPAGDRRPGLGSPHERQGSAR